MKLKDYIKKELEDTEYYNTHCPGYTGVYHIMYRNSNLVSFKMPHNANGEELALFNGDPGANGIMLCYSSNPPTDPNELCYNKKTNKFTQIPNHLNVKDINGNTLLNELESLIDTISQISSYQSSNGSYPAQNATLTQNINSAKQRTIDFQTQVNSLQTQVNSFQISDSIRPLNAKQKAHILQKIWSNRDSDSVSMLNAIKQQGFDPHYVHQNGQSLVVTALSRNYMTLFDLLISNNLDFNNIIAEKTIFQMVLAANRGILTFAHSHDSSLAKIGSNLLHITDTIFRLYNLHKENKLEKARYLTVMQKIKEIMLYYLQDVTNTEYIQAQRVANNILKSFDMIWLFLYDSEIELTNNLAERQVKHFVKYRL